MKRTYVRILTILLFISSLWTLYKSSSPEGLNIYDAAITTLIVLLLNYTIYKEDSRYGKTFLVVSLIYVGFFVPVFIGYVLGRLGIGKYLLSLDEIVVSHIVKSFGILSYLTEKGIVFYDGNTFVTYTYSCSSLRALTFVLPLIACECEHRRKLLASLIGYGLGMTVPWIRLYLMVLLMTRGFDAVMLHFLVSPTVVLTLGTLVASLEAYICPDFMRKMLISYDFITKQLSFHSSKLRFLTERSGGI